MVGAEQDGIQVLVQVEVLLVKGDFAVGGFGLAQAADGGQVVGAEVGQDVLDAPEAVGAGLDFRPISRQAYTNWSST